MDGVWICVDIYGYGWIWMHTMDIIATTEFHWVTRVTIVPVRDPAEDVVRRLVAVLATAANGSQFHQRCHLRPVDVVEVVE